jgi:curved DNA-binding protein CbpA
MKNYYKVLGVPEHASEKQIHSAYRSLAKKYHPDINNGNADIFKNIVEAYEILKDPRKKEDYDNHFAVGGLSEKKTMIESMFNGYLMSISAGVLFLYSALLFVIAILLFDRSMIIIFLSLIILSVGIYLKFKSFNQ